MHDGPVQPSPEDTDSSSHSNTIALNSPPRKKEHPGPKQPVLEREASKRLKHEPENLASPRYRYIYTHIYMENDANGTEYLSAQLKKPKRQGVLTCFSSQLGSTARLLGGDLNSSLSGVTTLFSCQIQTKRPG